MGYLTVWTNRSIIALVDTRSGSYQLPPVPPPADPGRFFFVWQTYSVAGDLITPTRATQAPTSVENRSTKVLLTLRVVPTLPRFRRRASHWPDGQWTSYPDARRHPEA